MKLTDSGLLYLAVLLGTAMLSWVAVPVWCGWCLRCGWVDAPGGRKDHSGAIPLAGGPAVLTALVLALAGGVLAVGSGLLPSAVQAALGYGLEKRGLPLMGIGLGAMGMAVLGWVDDRLELPAWQKFAGQFAMALIVAACGVRVTLFVPSLIFSYAVTMLWIVGLTNAVNFLDNMNGLCAGIGLIAAAWFAAAAAFHGQYLVTFLALVVVGALAGYLPHNFPRARAFLGDSGSLLVGYLLAVTAILPHFYSSHHPVRLAVLTPVVVLAVPWIDLVQVVVTRTLRGKPFWVGDHNHLSHRLVRLGLNRVHAVMVLWLAAFLAGACTLPWW